MELDAAALARRIEPGEKRFIAGSGVTLRETNICEPQNLNLPGDVRPELRLGDPVRSQRLFVFAVVLESGLFDFPEDLVDFSIRRRWIHALCNLRSDDGLIDQ